MSVDRIMHRNLVSVASSETVAAAVQRMSDHDLGAVLVVDDGELRGIFSERDLLRRVVAAGADIQATKVGTVATKEPTTVAAKTPVRECYEIFKAKGFRHLPIVGDDGKPVGIISSRDLLRCMMVEMDPFPEHLRLEEIGTLYWDMYGPSR